MIRQPAAVDGLVLGSSTSGAQALYADARQRYRRPGAVMEKSRTIRRFGLLGRGWARCRAPLGSIVLHALLLIGLLLLKPSADPLPTSEPRIIVVEMVMFDEAGDDTGGQIPDAPAIAEEPEPAAGDGERVARDELAAELPLDVGSPQAVEPLPETNDAEPTLVESAPALEDPVEELLDRPAEPPAIATVEPAPVTEDVPPLEADDPLPLEATTSAEAELIANVPEPLALPELPRVPTTAAPDDREREMLTERFAAMSASLDTMSADDFVWEHDGQQYSATVMHVGSDDSMGIENVLVSVSTDRDGSRWSTKMRMKRLSFSSFAQFVDRWDSSVQVHDDVIDGRFHSNSEIYVSRTRRVQPSFRGKVTTARRINTSNSERRVRRDEVFLGGLETRVPRIDVPKQFVAHDAIAGVPDERVHRFDTSSRIVFYADGSFAWQPLKGDLRMQRVQLTDESHYLIGGDGVSLRVSGIVNGKVLVYAPDDIMIVDDLLYADHPRFDPNADDYVGLVADRNVVIGASRLTGRGDLTIHGAIYAKRRFLVRHFNSGGGYTLRVFGSLAAGSLAPTEPRFRTRLEFDGRLEDARPPGFPVTDRFEVVDWDGEWTEELPAEPG
jgi:hypothetical protein